MSFSELMTYFCLGCVLFPALLLVILGLSALISLKIRESLVVVLTQWSASLSLASAFCVLGLMLSSGERFVTIDVGDWVSIEQEQFHFHIRFIFDRLSIPFLILSLILCLTVATFTRRYLHREPGFNRFFLLYAFFLNGIVLSSVAGTIETLFFGWELVGISSALLVAFFLDRESPVENGQRVWGIYRFADSAFLLGALAMHHFTGHGDFAAFVGTEPWPESQAVLSANQAFLVGCLLLVAACGKSALVPFSGWLARAMEGPTPSTAIFYGALSIHLGAYLLLRVSPVLESSIGLRILIVAIGLSTAITGWLISRVGCDVKSVLAYASLTQVGIIVVEIGLGLYYLALIHLVGHACLRTMQLLRAPTLITDYQAIENALGNRMRNQDATIGGWLPRSMQLSIYRFGYDRGYMDLILDSIFIKSFKNFFLWADRQERRWADFVCGETTPSANIELHPEEQMALESDSESMVGSNRNREEVR
jgi:NADH:ubiquinone oxidoreductase subunit 5 (subunit L)/multisubunit Na+/H+ antiporter MnhA subunit